MLTHTVVIRYDMVEVLILERRIRMIRKSQKLSQAEFGARLGVTRNVIANIEGGRVKPTGLFLDHLCTTFLVNRQWLMEGKGDMFAGMNANISEALRIFEELRPEFQVYAIQQIEVLLELQRAIKQ